MNKLTIYLAHPITGHTGWAVWDYYSYLVRTLAPHYMVIHPMLNKEHLQMDSTAALAGEGLTHPVTNNHAIFTRDKWSVQTADIILVDLEGAEKVSIGCMMEMAWASAYGKHVVTVLPEANPHNHAFVREASHVIYPRLEEALTYLIQFQLGRTPKEF